MRRASAAERGGHDLEMGGMRTWVWVVGALVAACRMAAPAAAQELADFDYEHLSFRGIGFEGGYLPAQGIHGVRGKTQTWGARLDLGYLGPGLRISPSVTYWQSELDPAEVSSIETRIEQLIVREVGDSGTGAEVDLGKIVWRDVVVGVDSHIVWNIPFGWLSFLGLGASVHVLDGRGETIEDTFIDDLLDSVRPGVNVHAGLEYPLGRWARLYWHGRYEVTDDLRYLNARGGLQVMFGGVAAGEIEPR